MAILNLSGEIKRAEERLQAPEQMLGKGALMPFNNANSGSRKIMFGVHLEQRLPLIHSEPALIQTGYEAQFGEYSSSFNRVDDDLFLVARIPKFSSDPYNHYFAIIRSGDDKHLSMFERVEYKHISESYGYLYDNSEIDRLETGDMIKAGTVIQKSTSFDEYNNRMDGINLLSCYTNIEATMEDGIVLSESAAAKLASPLLKKVTIIVNDNDIPLNIYGDFNFYKSFPDIGEDCKNGILCALRREKKEEALYSQSYNRLREVMMSDEKYTLTGKVVDVNVYVNNPDKLRESSYNIQICKYYDDYYRMCTQIVEVVTPYLANGATMSYELQKLYHTARSVIEKKQYLSDNKVFSSTILEIVVMEENKFGVGDKLSNRYGGKGVVSEIRPDYLMPRSETGEFIEIIFNPQTLTNRLNGGQAFETSINFIARRILQYIQMEIVDIGECIEMYLKFLYLVSPKLGKYTDNYLDTLDDEGKVNYITSLCSEKGMFLSIEPMSESMTIDRLAEIYKEFSWIKLDHVEVPMQNSNGTYRYVKANRPIVVAPQYIYRLKQYAEEKFSVTSLSATNIRNENSRNKAKNNYKALFPKTPIRFGEMESGDLNHVGPELVVQMLMLYSASPHARRLCEQMLTGDPFNIDIKLDMKSKNRNVEILNVYLKSMGLRLKFNRTKKKKIKPVLFRPVTWETRIRPVHWEPRQKAVHWEPRRKAVHWDVDDEPKV